MRRNEKRSRSNSPRSRRDRSRSRDRTHSSRRDGATKHAVDDKRSSRHDASESSGSSRRHAQSGLSKFETVDVNALLQQPVPPPPPPVGFMLPQMPIVSPTAPNVQEPAAAAGEAPAAPAADVPSVEAFVPSIPKSLLQLVLPGVGSLTIGGSTAPMMSAEFAKLTRESRRCHVTGFTHIVQRQDLLAYFSMLTQDVRRHMTERETGRPVPENAIVDVDQVVDVALDATKAKPFAFVEFSNADIVTELIAQCSEDKDRFVYHSARDGSMHTLLLRRPKDYVSPSNHDAYKVVLQGIPTFMPEERIRGVAESFGADLGTFQRNDRFVYFEFPNSDEAKECVEDLHGQVLGGRLVLAQHVSEPLRGLLIQGGMRLTEHKAEGGGEGSAYESGGLDKRDHVREAMEFTTPLNQAVLNLKKTFPFLEPQFGTNIPVFPTRILVLLNLFDEADIVLDEDYSKLLAELSEELEQYGRVKQLIVPRRTPAPVPPKPLPPKKFERKVKQVNVLPLQNPFASDTQSGGGARAADASEGFSSSNAAAGDDEYEQFLRDKEDEEKRFQEEKDNFHRAREEWLQRSQHPVHGGIGRVFAEYETVDEAALAQRSIAGKLFHLRTVVTSFLFEDVLYPPAEDEADASRAADAAVDEYLRTQGLSSTEGGESTSEIPVEQNHATAEESESAADLD